MITKILFLTIFQIFAQVAETPHIADWTEVNGLSEVDAVRLTNEAIKQELTVDEDGEVCPVDEIWGYERSRGSVVAVEAYAKGPDYKCERTLTYDCRVVFTNRQGGQWSAAYAECDASGPQPND